MADDTVLLIGALTPFLVDAVSSRYRTVRWPTTETDAIRAVVTVGSPGVDDTVMAALPNLGAIINHGAGYDTIDVEAARARGIGLSNTPDVLTETVADTAVALVLNTLRQFGAAERYLRAGRWAADGDYPLTRDVNGTQVGILGLGRIGAAIVARLEAFDCAIAYHNRRAVPDSPYRYAPSVYELAESVDVLVVATAGGKGTQKLVNREVLEALGPQGYLINIARGSVVDQEALIELLQAGELAGAGLDVFTHEPQVPAELRALDTVTLLPHVGSATARTREAMALLALRNLETYLNSGGLVTPVVRPHR